MECSLDANHPYLYTVTDHLKQFDINPIPSHLNRFVIYQHVQAYLELLQQALDYLTDDNELALEQPLKAIYAEILRAYDLPPKLERVLLDYFNGHPRPVSHRFSDYYPSDQRR